MTSGDSEVLPFETFMADVHTVGRMIAEDRSFRPDSMLALSSSGFFVGAALFNYLRKYLDIPPEHLVGVPITKDYNLDETLITVNDCHNRSILVVDDSSDRGFATKEVVDTIISRGGLARSCVLMANKAGLQPHYVARQCEGKPPGYFWKTFKNNPYI